MTQGLARFHARSPRYFLNTEDESLVRVAGPRQTPWEEGTEIRNVSLTGLAFTAWEDLCPLLGEVIRIQFTIPGGQQMACHAIVTRLEEDKRGTMLVAVHFYKMDMALRIILAQGLSRKFRAQLARRNKQVDLEERSVWQMLPAGVVLFTTLWLWCLLTYIVSSEGLEGLWSFLKSLIH